MVRAHWNGAVIAETDDTVIIEDNHYFPWCGPCKVDQFVRRASTLAASSDRGAP